MIQWWGWLLIWVALVLVLLTVLGILAFGLVRKALALIHELSELVDKTTALDVETAELTKPQIAFLAEMSAIRAQHEAQQQRRAEKTHARHERRIARAKRITKRDASTMQWPKGWA